MYLIEMDILKAKLQLNLMLLNKPTGLQRWCGGMATAYWYSERLPTQLSKPRLTFNLQPK